MNRSSLPSLAVLALFASAGCTGPLDGKSAVAIFKERLTTLPFAGNPAPNDRYLAISGKKKNKDGHMLYGVNRDLWPPFRYEASAGLMNEDKQKLGNAFFCIEVDARDSSPFEYYAVCAAKGTTEGTLTAFATSSAGNIGTPHDFEATKVLEFAIEHDGTDLNLLARAEGDVDYVEIASVPLMNPAHPFVPRFSAALLHKKNCVGFDNIRIPANGTSPNKLTESQVAARMVYNACDAASDALYKLDGTDPETAIAQILLESANSQLDDAQTAVALIAGAPAASALDKLGKAHGKFDAAIQAIENGKKPDVIGDKIGLGLEKMFDAAALLDPAE